MQPTLTELQRLIDNLIRIGTVTAVRSGECRVKTGDIITNWRPYATARAGKNRTRHRLSIGEQVLMLSVRRWSSVGVGCMGPLFWAMASKARVGQCVRRWHTGGGGYSPLVRWASRVVSSWSRSCSVMPSSSRAGYEISRPLMRSLRPYW